jgi:hypothetical protein
MGMSLGDWLRDSQETPLLTNGNSAGARCAGQSAIAAAPVAQAERPARRPANGQHGKAMIFRLAVQRRGAATSHIPPQRFYVLYKCCKLGSIALAAAVSTAELVQ